MTSPLAAELKRAAAMELRPILGSAADYKPADNLAAAVPDRCNIVSVHGISKRVDFPDLGTADRGRSERARPAHALLKDVRVVRDGRKALVFDARLFRRIPCRNIRNDPQKRSSNGAGIIRPASNHTLAAPHSGISGEVRFWNPVDDAGHLARPLVLPHGGKCNQTAYDFVMNDTAPLPTH